MTGRLTHLLGPPAAREPEGNVDHPIVGAETCLAEQLARAGQVQVRLVLQVELDPFRQLADAAEDVSSTGQVSHVSHRASLEGTRTDHLPSRTDRAAWKPHMPWTPPPGGVDDEQR